MSIVFAAAGTVPLVGVALDGQAATAGQLLFWVAVPYAALAILVAGFCYRVARWAWSPVPFRIPTTCGQQKSLPWIKSSPIECPSNGIGAVARMALEILLFRSLFRNNRAELRNGQYLYGESKSLWLGALAFHWALLVIVLRHLRLLVQPVPAFVNVLDRFDSFFQVGTPAVYITDAVVVIAGLYLLLRRWRDPLARYLSRFADYFVLFLLLAIAGSGILMRYSTRVDLVAVKRLALGLATFHPVIPDGLSAVFAIHLMLVCTLAVYFPFSKLVHMGGVFLSPTRNLANNSRMKRHINPWNYPVKTHSYTEWEEEFRDKIKAAGIPLDEAESGGTTHTD
jgi:nitrate reductase gamma subunit